MRIAVLPRRRNRQGDKPVPEQLPPRIDATADEIAEAFFAMPPDHEWKYVKEKPAEYDGSPYRCVDCDKEVSYPEVLHYDGRSDTCHPVAT